ncbi:deoxyribonuclease V [Krasilnikovia sp. MM14-A1259]|uniref:deoxyribonuclease V n=1 Tax=Krasilnikovia sp. MM14-A1259 TaxID=3373539 RepID=UPI00399D18B4
MTIAEAQQVQHDLRLRVDLTTRLTAPAGTVAGVDVSYESGTRRVAAAAVLLSLPDLEVVESALAFGEVNFPYVPGLLAFREIPFILDALGRLTRRPDVLICDGYGVAHPMRFGLACHVGVLTDIPTFGVAKTAFTSTFADPDDPRGSWSPLVDDGETVGRALRTQTAVKPVFVSVGHRIGLDEASELTLGLAPKYRIPEVIRQADHLSRQALRK